MQSMRRSSEALSPAETLLTRIATAVPRRAAMDEPSTTIAHRFLDCLGESRVIAHPFRHWLLRDALPEEVALDITRLPIGLPEIRDTQGRRETHNDMRVFFSPERRSTGRQLSPYRVLPGYRWFLAGATYRHRRQAVHHAHLCLDRCSGGEL